MSNLIPMPQNSSQIDSFAPRPAIAHWVVQGRVLMVKQRILNVAKDCNITFNPANTASVIKGDAIESVEFWFRYPIAGGILYVPDPKTGLLRPAIDEEAEQIPNNHKQWLIRFTGKTARAVRRLYQQLYDLSD